MCEMTIETVKSTIKGHLGELLNLNPAQIGDNDLLIDDLGADSIVIVQLYLSCQEDFGIQVSEELDLYISQSSARWSCKKSARRQSSKCLSN